MDGVLLYPEGYYCALQISVDLVGRNLGIAKPQLSRKHISTFEAAGITHVWDLMVIFTAFNLIQIWEFDPNVRVPLNINPDPTKFAIEGGTNFSNFIQKIDLNGLQPLTFTEAILAGLETQLNSEQIDYLKLILSSCQDLTTSPVLPILQEFILGSLEFSQTYNCASQLNTESIPQKYNQAALTSANLDKLIAWLKFNHHQAAIFTNRPSKPPDGILRMFSTPEAELGAASIGLQQLPIIGAGSLVWLAEQKSQPAQAYIKPNPVHALAALQAAIGKPIPMALNLANDLANGSGDIAEWVPIKDSKIMAFEDSAGGLVSAKKAVQILDQNNIYTDLQLIGVSDQPTKVKPLAQIADQVITDINADVLQKIIA